MALARYQGFAVDEQGNVLPNASIGVVNEATGAKPQLYSDRAGATAKGNEFTADPDGFFFFHVVGGAYRIDITLGDVTRTLRYVGIGTAQERDLPVGGYGSRIVTAAGDVEVLPTDVMVVIRKDTGAATNVIIPPSVERSGARIIIKDGKGDADVNPISFVSGADPAETADGQPFSAFQIRTKWGLVALDPLPDGSGYHCNDAQI